jgi:hypothetical protein
LLWGGGVCKKIEEGWEICGRGWAGCYIVGGG